MASFEERVKAAMEGFCAAKMDGKGTEESVCGALRAADATEPEIGAVRRWLAGETVDAATLPRMLSETIRALAEAQQVAERAQGGDAVRQWLDGAGVHEDALPKRLRMTLVELRCARKQRDEARAEVARLKQERDALARFEAQAHKPGCARCSGRTDNAPCCRHHGDYLSDDGGRMVCEWCRHDPYCDALQPGPQLGPPTKPCNCQRPCEYCNHVPGCGPRDGCDCAVCCHDPTPDDGGDVIDWKARALAAEAEVAAEKAAHDGTREALRVCVDGENALTAEVAKLRAALERETAPRMWVGRMAGVEPCTRCGAKWVD